MHIILAEFECIQQKTFYLSLSLEKNIVNWVEIRLMRWGIQFGSTRSGKISNVACHLFPFDFDTNTFLSFPILRSLLKKILDFFIGCFDTSLIDVVYLRQYTIIFVSDSSTHPSWIKTAMLQKWDQFLAEKKLQIYHSNHREPRKFLKCRFKTYMFIYIILTMWPKGIQNLEQNLENMRMDLFIAILFGL